MERVDLRTDRSDHRRAETEREQNGETERERESRSGRQRQREIERADLGDRERERADRSRPPLPASILELNTNYKERAKRELDAFTRDLQTAKGPKAAVHSRAQRNKTERFPSGPSLYRDSRFTQHEVPARKLLWTPGCVVILLIFFGITYIPIGLASLFASRKVVEIAKRYDEDCIPPIFRTDTLSYIQSSDTNKTCKMILIVPRKMRSPVFVYYQLDDFYQNHRRYVKSRSDNQLHSKEAEFDVKDCSPKATTNISNKEVPIVPCGLIAWSLFNDTYGFSLDDRVLQVHKTDIAWRSDGAARFGSDVYPKNFQSEGLIGGAKLNESIPLSEQEDLQVWMRVATLSTFRKLYGRIEVDLEANETVTVVIENNYNTYTFGGTKTLVLSTTTWIGGKNDFIGIAFLAAGGLFLFAAVIFICLIGFGPRPRRDASHLSWNRNPAGN